MQFAGVRFFSLVFTFTHVGHRMIGEFVTLVSLGFLIGMIVGVALT